MKLVCCVLMCLLGGLLASAALAAQRPSPATRQAIRRVVKRYVLRTGCCHVSTMEFGRAKQSTVDLRWAEINFDGWDARGVEQGWATAAVHRDRSGRWHTVDLGTAGLGCKMPRAVRRDLYEACF